MKQLIVILLALFLAVLFNYYKAQVNLRNSSPTQFSLTVTDPPILGHVGQPITFSWLATSTGNFSVSNTAIYYDTNSTPSALTKKDSPSAVGYARHTTDYDQGLFPLPQNFTASVVVDKPETIYYRAYAKVGDDHLWTKEYSLPIK